MKAKLLMVCVLTAAPAVFTFAADDKPGEQAAAAASASAPKRDPQAILDEIEKLDRPQFDQSKANDPKYIEEFRAGMIKAVKRQSELAKEFYESAPNHEKADEMRSKRWQILMQTGDRETLASETAAFLKDHPDSKLKPDALYMSAVPLLMSGDSDIEKIEEAVKRFTDAAPDDPRGANLLMATAGRLDDSAKQTEIYKQIAEKYGDSPAGNAAKGQLKKLEAVGKPFELAFTDAISGKPVSMETLKGKVVVVDFWATWCGPCVAEMPNMKKLYAQYKDKGVEFVGVSLDQPESAGGLKKLKEFVAKNEIGWPQYFQGNGWESEFSKGWGINSIPAVFVVDADGKLYSIEARGKLEKLIPELLEKKGKKEVSSAAK